MTLSISTALLLFMFAPAAPANEDAILLDLTPVGMPPTRTTCEVRTKHLTVKVEWNPEDLSHLRQRVSLPRGATEVDIQCWSALPGKGSTAQSWAFPDTETFDLSSTKTGDIKMDGTSITLMRFTVAELPSIDDRLVLLDTQLAGDASVRSLASPVPDAVAETAKVLGDIALKRAKANAREMLMDRMTGAICGDGDKGGAVLLPRYWLYLPEDPGKLESTPKNGTEAQKNGTEAQENPKSPKYEYKIEKDAEGAWTLSTAGTAYCQGDTRHPSTDKNRKDPNECKYLPQFDPPTAGGVVDKDAEITVSPSGTTTLDRGVKARTTIQLRQTCQLVRGRSLADLSRSGPELARALEADALIMLVDNLKSVSLAVQDFPESVIPMLEILLPVLLDAAQESRAPTTREAMTVLTSFRQLLESPAVGAGSGQRLKLALAIVADCVEAGACDLRLVSAKVARPWHYYSDHSWSNQRTRIDVRQQQRLVRIVDGFYALFATDSQLKDRDRAAAAIGAVFEAITLVGTTKSSDDPKMQALSDTLNALQRIVLASIRDDFGVMTIEAAAMFSALIRLNVNDSYCDAPEGATRSDTRRQCGEALLQFARRLERSLPWITTLASHAVQIRDERNGSLSAAELEQNAEARKKALEELIDRSTDRGGRHGDWVWSFGAGVGARAAMSVRKGPEFVETPLTLPIGVAVQRLPGAGARAFRPKTREKRMQALKQRGALSHDQIGVGFHLQASPVDVGQYVFLSDDIVNVTWNQFLSANGQIGILVGTPRNNVVIALDYRYVPARLQGSRHELGLALTYYIPFFDFN